MATTSSVLKSANLQPGIDYEIRQERIGMQIAKKIAEMSRAGRLGSPNEDDLAEIRRLETLRGN